MAQLISRRLQPRNRGTITAICLLLLVAPFLGGCGNPSGRVPVTGTINFKGKPLDQGFIRFEPLEGSSHRSGANITDGKFEIPGEKGLPPGVYRVEIYSADIGKTKPVADFTTRPPPPPERIPAKYNSQSKEKLTVVAGEAAVYNLDIN